MENETVTITLTVAGWQALLNIVSLAPFSAVNQISAVINDVQTQAGEQIKVLQEKYPAPEAAPAAE